MSTCQYTLDSKNIFCCDKICETKKFSKIKVFNVELDEMQTHTNETIRDSLLMSHFGVSKIEDVKPELYISSINMIKYGSKSLSIGSHTTSCL